MIKMKTLYAGPDGVISPGVICDFGKEKNAALVSGGFAEYVKYVEKNIESVIGDIKSEVIETATFTPAEKAIKPKPHIRKRGK